MKKSLFLFTICMIACIYISCEKSNAGLYELDVKETEIKPDNPATLQVRTNITPTISVTRSVSYTALPSNSEMGLFVRGVSDQPYCDLTNNNNVKSVYNGAKWVNTPDVLLTQEPATIYAYYPYRAEETDLTKVHIDHTRKQDFLFGSNAGQETKPTSLNPVADLQLKHAFALLQFKVSKTTYAGTGRLSSISIWNINSSKTLLSEGDINLKTGVITKNPDRTGWAQVSNGSNPLQIIPTTPSANEADYPKLYVMPCNIKTGNEVSFSFSIDGYGYQFPVPANTTWESGKKYLYNVVLSGSAINAQNVGVTDWVTGGSTGNIAIN